ncbi:MAG: hypothetical protein RR307_00515 [Clostridia bacterium]
MNENLTELVFLLDRSGSMQGLERDVIGGFNSLITKQKNEKGIAKVTTVLFDDDYEMLYSRKNLTEVKDMSVKEYYVRGSTALLDAIGKSINDIGKQLSDTPESERPSKVLFVITTDGYENASKEYTVEQVKTLITQQKEVYNWEFLFLGANIDAIKTACSFGISNDRASNFVADEQGVNVCMNGVGSAISSLRRGKKIECWKEEISKDYNKRSKNPLDQVIQIPTDPVKRNMKIRNINHTTLNSIKSNRNSSNDENSVNSTSNESEYEDKYSILIERDDIADIIVGDKSKNNK